MAKKKKKKAKKTRKDSSVLMVDYPLSPNARRRCRVFTPKKNYPYLIQFARRLKANLMEVKVKKANVLELKEVCEAIRNGTDQGEIEFEVTKDITPPLLLEKTTSKTKKESRIIIKKTIAKLLLTGKPVSSHELYLKFDNLKISKQSILRYFKNVREDMSNEGLEIIKIKNGEYVAKNV